QACTQFGALALRPVAWGQASAEDAAGRHGWARLAADSHVLALKSRRALQAARRGDPPGPEGSSTRVRWSEAHQRLLELGLDLLGPDACLAGGSAGREEQGLMRAYLWSRAETILAGTSEIQRNIIGEQILGLPKG